MDNWNEFRALIGNFTGEDNFIVIPCILVKFTGDIDSAILLNQIIYWSDKGDDGTFYKTYKEWEDEICLSEYKVRKCVLKFKEMGFLETTIKKANGSPTVFYTFKWDNFKNGFLNFLRNQTEKTSETKLKKLQKPNCKNLRNHSEKTSETKLKKLQKPCTENTTENTTKNTTKSTIDKESNIFVNKNITKEKDKKQTLKNSSSNNTITKEKQNFVPPTVEEVQDYIYEKKYSIDAEAFVAFYESKGWMIGRNKMRNWKAALVTWEKRNKNKNNNYNSSYTQRIRNDPCLNISLDELWREEEEKTRRLQEKYKNEGEY